MYTALYRKWRPLSFDDVISQPHITQTLKNQIKGFKTAHAYLFTGSRGTGKTTCARIFAKAVNCPNEKDGNPCLECDVCKDADNFALSDIIEIDAASNNGVDDIRDLRDGAVYTPERCKYKIYIIDEVHMLSPNAFNALLKIMEEPPEYVKFILATTEVHKVPTTITSRCQRFDFKRIKAEDIKDRLCYIAGLENLQLDENAARLIAKLSDGGMRDALSLLDQCAAYSENITSETVSAAAGITGRDNLFEIIEAVVSKDTGKALSVIDSLYSMSKDIAKLCIELIEQFRNLMIIKSCSNYTELIACMPDELERLKNIAKQTELTDILSKLTILQECSERMAKALNKRVEFEMCLIKLCNIQIKQNPIDNTGVYGKINTDVQTESKEKTSKVVNATTVTSEYQMPNPEVDIKNVKTSDFKMLMEWTEIQEELRKISPSVSGTLTDSRAYVYKNIMLIIAQNQFFMRLFKIQDNLNALGMAVENVMGKKYVIRAKCNTGTVENNKADVLIKKAENSGIETAVE